MVYSTSASELLETLAEKKSPNAAVCGIGLILAMRRARTKPSWEIAQQASGSSSIFLAAPSGLLSSCGNLAKNALRLGTSIIYDSFSRLLGRGISIRQACRRNLQTARPTLDAWASGAFSAAAATTPPLCANL